jgi:hypothetical protein
VRISELNGSMILIPSDSEQNQVLHPCITCRFSSHDLQAHEHAARTGESWYCNLLQRDKDAEINEKERCRCYVHRTQWGKGLADQWDARMERNFHCACEHNGRAAKKNERKRYTKIHTASCLPRYCLSLNAAISIACHVQRPELCSPFGFKSFGIH